MTVDGVADTELACLQVPIVSKVLCWKWWTLQVNVDIITLALNMYTHGVDPKLTSLTYRTYKVYERLTRMSVYATSIYTGQLVFAAFSDLIRMRLPKVCTGETKIIRALEYPIPSIDPHDVGREYESDVIRINSQSGKRKIYQLCTEENFGFHIPGKMREDVGYTVKDVSDKRHQELVPRDILKVFKEVYVNIDDPCKLKKMHFCTERRWHRQKSLCREIWCSKLYHEGNGRLDAVSNALQRHSDMHYSIVTYQEHALNVGSNSQACAYVGIQEPNGNVTWGSGIHGHHYCFCIGTDRRCKPIESVD